MRRVSDAIVDEVGGGRKQGGFREYIFWGSELMFSARSSTPETCSAGRI